MSKKKVSADQANLFGGFGVVTQETQTRVMVAAPTPTQDRLEGAYLICDECKEPSRVVYIPIDEVSPKDWHRWVADQVGWDPAPDGVCPRCEDKRRFRESYQKRTGL